MVLMDTTPHKKFSDFNTNSKVYDGKKKSIEAIINKEILIKSFKLANSKYKTKEYATVQFNDLSSEDKIENFIFFTGSGVIMDQLTQNKEHLPFLTTIKKIDKYYTFS